MVQLSMVKVLVTSFNVIFASNERVISDEMFLLL